MVKDKHNQIYTELYDYMKSLYPSLKGGTTFNENDPQLPFLYFFQIDGSTKLTTLSNTEDGINLAYQIEVYTKDGKNNARKMANDIRTFMIQEGFRCRTFMPIEGSSNVSRFVTRFERLDV